MLLFLILLLGVEAIIFGIVLIILSRWGQRLDQYLVANYPRFYEENLRSRFWAGGWNVAKRDFRAIKNTYWGTMPDDQSRSYQLTIRHYGKIALICFFLFWVTLIVPMAVWLFFPLSG